MDELTNLFKNGTGTPLKLVVFDLDETLGYFVVFGMFWKTIMLIFKRPLTQMEFNLTMDLYPEFIRPNMVEILTLLKRKKEKNTCSNLMIYTNNQGPEEWAILIKSYFEWKIGGAIFDRIIPAFKVDSGDRTTKRKTHADFIRCANVPANSKICFVDDVFYNGMNTNNVYYIHIRPYIYDIPFNTLVSRYLLVHTSLNSSQFKAKCMLYLDKYHHQYIPKKEEDYKLDLESTSQLVKHIKRFFNHSKTKCLRKRGSNKTKRRK